MTEQEAAGAWSVADEMLLHLEAERASKSPMHLGDLIGAAVLAARNDGGDVSRDYAIRLGVLAMRLAMGERLVFSEVGKHPGFAANG